MQPGFTLAPRDTFADVQSTLSSWDSCMAKDYCKWPVIVAIILGGLIAFSVVFCIARCICCGAECAICCCKCCTCCCGSSDRGHKRMNSETQGYPPPQPYPQQPYSQPPYSNAPANPYAEARSFAPPPPPPQIDTQYQSHATPTFSPPGNPNFNPQTNPKFTRPASPDQPQFATFDAHRKPVNDDALPAMPSWNNARSVQVEVEEEAVPEKRGDVEMNRLNHDGSSPNTSTAGVAAGALGGGMRGSPATGRSPISPVQRNDDYGFPAGNQNQYDRRGPPMQNQNVSPYGANVGYAQNDVSRGPQTQNQNISPMYGGATLGHAQNDMNRGPSPALSYSQYSQASDTYDRHSPAPIQPLNLGYNQSYNNSPNTAQPPYNTPSERYNSPAPPSYHTTANPYANAPPPVQPYDQPRSRTPGYGLGSGNAGYDPVPRNQTVTPSAYPGQQSYQAFQPQGPQGQQYSGVARKPVEGSLRDV